MFKNGFIEEELPHGIDLVKEINKLKKEKNAIILGHYYLSPEVQDISDFLGDSLALSLEAKNTAADVIVFAGVKFMAETAKILNPSKKVLIPDLNAGCSLSDSCNPKDFKEFILKYPNHKVITYINSSTDIKVLSDIICTSSNAVKIVQSVPENQNIIFAPDENLGRYVEKISGRKMVLWNGACHVHKRFSISKILQLKQDNPYALVVAHPECPQDIIQLSDFVGSTSALLDFVTINSANSFIIVTEPGVIHQMQLKNKNKLFIPAPPENSICSHNECNYMKLNNLKNIYLTLKYELPEINISEDIRIKALKPLEEMIKLS
ncbi:MAG TPA: quinolinate synthase NadA [Salinivirgaceae bacterium]|nr:quinolinate synthase NadA [Salinivirgaceae bacterium]